MIVVQKNFGILILLILGICVGGSNYLWYEVLGFPYDQSYASNLYVLLGFFLAAIITFFLGKFLNKKVHIRTRDGQREFHSLFFIRMEYWGAILPILGIVLYLLLVI
ncbi:hypothetical protein [Desmospora activa]|uniref:Uncharacterized protein n=1 Tax=Desmospora activa DSM 45169 TaxID=1121389 RepID=A0A2T4Z3T9_9BACL|nr:hypothetical protein [Desmospora activa]PTM56545.1 hypothetical protein C8J48_2867 [Desmospora activa DSM 45169]